jgi:hypothetical protein
VLTFLLLDIDRDILSNTPVTKDYANDFKEALRELIRMSAEREQLETKIAKQKKRVAALYELVQTDEGSSAVPGLVDGLTDACRIVLRAAERPLFPAEVRDRVQALGLPSQSNLLASVHTTLKRLKDASEISELSMPLQTGGMGAAYEWGRKMPLLLSLLHGKGGIDLDLLPEEVRARIEAGPRGRRKPGIDPKAGSEKPSQTLGRMIGDGLFGPGKK